MVGRVVETVKTVEADDLFWMRRALHLAKRAAEEGEVPVAAVLVQGERALAEAWNQPIATHDPSAHAELQAIRQAAKRLGNYRLPQDTVMYVTLEPCAMCVGAMVHARVGRLIFAADDPKTGAVKSVFQLLDTQRLNHVIPWTSGILSEECAKLLSAFFREKRLCASKKNEGQRKGGVD